MKKREEKQVLPIWVYIILIAVLSFLIARYGWRITGFSQCNGGYSIEQVKVDENLVTIRGLSNYNNSMGGFVGTTYQQKGDVLYVGMKYNLFLGVIPSDQSEFCYHYPVEGTVNQIVLKGNGTESILWDRNATDRITVRVRVRNVLIEEVGYTCYLKGEVIASGGVTAYNDGDFVLPLVFMKEEFPEGGNVADFALGFSLRGSEKEITMKEPIKTEIDWGEETLIYLDVSEEELIATRITEE